MNIKNIIMYKQTFLLGILLVIGSALLIGYDFTIDRPGPGEPGFWESSKSQRNTHMVGGGILLLGGLLIGISKAMKKAAQNGRSLIDEMIDIQGTPTPKSKTKTIIVDTYGNTVDSNKKNTRISQQASRTLTSSGQSSATFILSEFKVLIGENKSAECLEQMRAYFQNTGNKSALNDVIHLNSRLRENEDRYNAGLIDDEQRNREKVKISRAILDLIDHEIEK